MSLSARRKRKTEVAQETTTQAVVPPAPVTTTNASGTTGSLRSIAIGRKYLEHEPSMTEAGYPQPRSVYDTKGRLATDLSEQEVDKGRVVGKRAFAAHINKTVFEQIFGVPLRGEIAKQILDGISDQVLTLVEEGYKVKLPNLITLTKAERAARMARNPQTGEPIRVPARTVIKAKATTAAKEYMRQSS